MNPNRGMVHFLTGHGPYPSHLCRFQLRADDICECGSVGTPDHIVLTCRRYNQIRQPLVTDTPLEQLLRDENWWSMISRAANSVSNFEQEKFRRQRQPVHLGRNGVRENDSDNDRDNASDNNVSSVLEI